MRRYLPKLFSVGAFGPWSRFLRSSKSKRHFLSQDDRLGADQAAAGTPNPADSAGHSPLTFLLRRVSKCIAARGSIEVGKEVGDFSCAR